MSDYTQVTFFAPKDALSTGNPSKLIKGTEVDPELSAIATAIATKYDSGDIADNTAADALVSDALLMTPLKFKRSIENGAFKMSFSGLADLGGAADSADLVMLRDVSASETKYVTVTNLFAGQGFVPNSRQVISGLGLDGGGDLSANRTLNVLAGAGLTFSGDDLIVGQGSGISVTADTVAVDRTNTTTTDATGYMDMPHNSQSGNYTLVLSDRGKTVFHPSGAGSGDTFTIPTNASVAFPLGTTITFINMDASTLAIAASGGVTLNWSGSFTTGTRTLAQGGIFTVTKVGTDQWLGSGSAVS